MADYAEADLMAVGQHCANPDCRQIDFLPFPCSGCGKVYCLQHRVCPECSEASKQSVVVCPLCAQAVVARPGEDVELAFDRHTRTECDPSNYAKVHKKPRCPAAGCKEKLTSINSYQCKDCGTTVCLKHRLASDHQCPGRAASAARAAQGRLGLGSSIRRMFGSNGSSAAAAGAVAGPARPQNQQQQQQQQPARPQQRQQPAPAAAGNGGTRAGVGHRAAAAAGRAANSVQAQLQQYRQRQQQRTGGGSTSSSTADVIDLTGASGPAPVAGGPEVCAQCGARFADVAALIAHAEAAHSSGWASGQIAQQRQQQGAGGGGGGGGLERCPHCGRGFSDAVQLVAHVEQQHGGGSSSCVLS